MLKERKRHLERLAQIIYWTRSFTEDELARNFLRFQQGPGKMEFVETMREHLENLRREGVLGLQGHRYFLMRGGSEN